MFCKNCGYEIDENKKFCPKCGTLIEIKKQTSQEVKNLESKKAENNSFKAIKHQSKKRKRSVKKAVSLLLIFVLLIGIGGYTGVNIVMKGKYCSSYASKTLYEDELVSQVSMTYRDDGQILKQTVEDNEGVSTTYDFVYDEFGKVSTIIESAGDSVNKYNVKYNKTGDTYKGESSFVSGESSEFTDKFEFIYDNSVKLISEKAITNNGNSILENHYDEMGQNVEVINKSSDNVDRYVYTYSESGQKDGFTWYNNDVIREKNGPIYQNSSEYEIEDIHYEENGEIKEILYTKIVPISSKSDRYVIYDENNNETGSYKDYTYDNKISRNILKIDSYNDDGELYQSDEYEYKWKDFSDWQTWKDVLLP